MSSRIIGTIDLSRYDFAADIAYLSSVEKGEEEYDEFAEGYWKNVSLINATGVDGDTQYRNADSSMRTGHMSGCPEIERMIFENFAGDAIRMVRARNLVDGVVIPHRDFVELDKEVRYLRVFIPIETNVHSFHSDEDGVFQMMPGEVWFLDASINHAAVNFSKESRMFVCIDFAFNGDCGVAEIFSGRNSDSSVAQRRNIDRPAMRAADFADMLASMAVKLAAGSVREAVIESARLHFKYDFTVDACYTWLIRAGVATGNLALVGQLERLRRFLIESREMSERFSF